MESFYDTGFTFTYLLFCGSDTLEAVVETAIRGGIDMIGITDHSYGIASRTQHLQHSIQDVETDYDQNTRRYFNT